MVTLLALVSTAFAGAPDLTTSITPPSGAYVYQSARWYFTVANGGSANTTSTTLTINLPRTNTSPGVSVMGTVGAKSSGCTQSGATITCNVGALRKGRSTQVYVDLTLPESANPITFTTTASAPGETNTGNNGASATASLNNYSPNLLGSETATVNHCTGTNLSSYFECELYPSSISTHSHIFHTDGSITFPPEYGPDYGGTWWQDSPDHLAFVYTEFGTVVAEFEGWGTSANCFEGLTEFFPASSYMSVYEVCF